MTRGRLPAGRESGAGMPTALRCSEEALAALGKETALDLAARLEGEGRGAEAERVRRWVNRDPREVLALIRSLPAALGGKRPERANRELRVSMCNVAFLARRAGVVGFARRGCKDRLCPACGERRRRRFTARLREHVASLEAARRERLAFVTLTQPKLPGEEPGAALDRLLASFKRFLRSAWAKRYIAGGVRSMEVTARRSGASPKRDGHKVQSVGTHAHLHCIVELREGASHNELKAAWGTASPGSHHAAQDVQAVDEENIYQVGSYVLDMSGLADLVDAAPGYAAKVLAALHGRRLVAAWGTWKGVDLGLREAEGTLEYGDRSVYTLATSGPDAGDVTWRTKGDTMTAEEALRRLLEGPEGAV